MLHSLQSFSELLFLFCLCIFWGFDCVFARVRFSFFFPFLFFAGWGFTRFLLSVLMFLNIFILFSKDVCPGFAS